MAIMNIARFNNFENLKKKMDHYFFWDIYDQYIYLSAGKFSSDRTIAEYAREIWGMEPRWGEIFTSFFNRFFIFMGKRLSETFTFQHSKNVFKYALLLVASYLFHSPTSQLGEAARPPRSEPGKQGEFSRVDFRSAVWDS